MKNKSLKVNLAGLSLENPTMLTSGILGYSALTLKSIAEGGAGAVVTKSVGLKPRRGYANPTVVQVDCGLVNAVGLPNPGIDEFVKDIREAKAVLTVPLIVSVYGFSAEEYAWVAEKAVKAGADAVELNVSCPHVKETGIEIGQNPMVLAEVVREVKRAMEKPVFVKLSPNVADIAEIAEAAVKAGADAITAINTVKAMAIDIETAKPILSNKRGGLSGHAIKPIAVRCVYDIYEKVKKPIIGCGGITSWQDAVEFMLAGASAVQIGTAIALKGPGVFKSVVMGINTYLKRKGFRSVNEIVGLAHRS
ncbi:MAG: dihydroorotate dehydrogenase [Candidatus Bathyarchaeota archaeon]|nr:dihydroorotate dehydrogenase [Candidatus Bathyarchaeota archaeon A05DMB-3]MDH7607536.1 dihydroorotate dehydrogenase [Candidatus Bathyarchaeota archaeon]